MSEHEFEPTPGLPAPLPDGERILWQGAPAWRALAVHALHARKVAIYFALLAAWHVFDLMGGGAGLLAALRGATWLLILGVAASAVLTGLAWAMARTTMYTVTSARLVLRFGVALPISMSIPFTIVQSAGIVGHRDGSSDLPLRLNAGQHVGYFVTWPHVRPWHLLNAQPTLRCVPDGARVAAILGDALATSVADVSMADRPAPAPTGHPSLTAAA